MKFNQVKEEIQKQALEILEQSEDKSKGIYEAVEMIVASQNEALIKQLQEENELVKSNAQLAAQLGLRVLNKEEKAFYSKLITANQSVTFTQEDIIPNSIVDRTLDDVKKESDTLKLVNMAPADVKKWITASKTGAAAWGGLTDALTAELTATIAEMPMDVNKLYVLLVVPKAVRDLALPFVDKYLNAILKEAMHDGLVAGYLDGNGKTGPIGVLRQISTTDTDGTQKAKTVTTSLTGFSPKQLAPVLSAISKGGVRAVSKLYLIANPADVFAYVNPALFYFNGVGYVNTSKIDIEVIQEPMCPSGKAVLTIEGEYTMGFGGLQITEYKEVKALDDCNVFVAKAYGNGRATDDAVAYVFNPTKLVEFVPAVTVNGTVTTEAAA